MVGFRVSWRGWRNGDSEWSPYQLGVMLALVAVIVHGMVDVPYFKNDLSLEFWTLLAIAWAGTQWSAVSSAQPAASQRFSGPGRDAIEAFSSSDS